jgi:hypothetical protein
MATGGQKGPGPWKTWPPSPPGKLIQEIKDACEGAPGGVHCVVEVRVENPIHEYRIITP